MSYNTSSHTVFYHRYHIVWITKYRLVHKLGDKGRESAQSIRPPRQPIRDLITDKIIKRGSKVGCRGGCSKKIFAPL